MTNWDILNQDKGLEEINVANTQKIVKRVSDLTIPEFKALMVECFEMRKPREFDTSMEKYKRLTTKPAKVEEVFVKDGKPISKEY